MLSEEGSYSVSTCYHHISRDAIVSLDNNIMEAINHMWELKFSSNIALFGWRFFLNRLPTKDLLRRMGVILDRLCVMCNIEDELVSHLFDGCVISKGVWRNIYSWLGSEVSLSMLEFKNFFIYWSKAGNKSIRINAEVV